MPRSLSSGGGMPWLGERRRLQYRLYGVPIPSCFHCIPGWSWPRGLFLLDHSCAERRNPAVVPACLRAIGSHASVAGHEGATHALELLAQYEGISVHEGEDEGEDSGNPKPLQAGYDLREGCGGGQNYDREYSYCRLDHGVPKYQGTRLRDAHAPNIVAAGSSVMEAGENDSHCQYERHYHQ